MNNSDACFQNLFLFFLEGGGVAAGEMTHVARCNTCKKYTSVSYFFISDANSTKAVMLFNMFLNS